MKNVIFTPFGNFQVKQNGMTIDFHCTSKIYSQTKSKNTIRIYSITIDTKNMKVGDQIICGFENAALEHYSREKRSNTLMIENETLMLGLCGYEPQYYEAERMMHSYCMEKYDENGFVYTIERNPEEYEDKVFQTKTITLALCCVEKNKFKDTSKEINEALTGEIQFDTKLVKHPKEITKPKIQEEPIQKSKEPKQPKNTFLTIFLFVLFLILYLLVSFVLLEQKIITNVTTEKMIIGVIGVLLISFACGNLGVKVVKKPKQRNPKLQYIITVILLILLFASLEMISYMILCASGMIKEEGILLIGLTIVSISFVSLIASSWKPKKEPKQEINLETMMKTSVKEEPKIEKEEKIEQPLKTETITKEEPIIQKEPVIKIEPEKQEKKRNLKLLELEVAFPKNLKDDLFDLAQTVEEQKEGSKENNLDSTYLLNHESITIPYRIYYDEIDDLDNLSENQKRMLYCIYTRNPNGHVREKYIKRLLSQNLQEWEIPYIMKASEDYVVEIIQTIYDNLKDKDNKQVQTFVENNKEAVIRSYQAMTNYWNLYYRETPFHHYVGRKLFRECFDYSKKMEKRRFKCACCGNYTIHGFLINYYHAPCPVCHWQNNAEQNNNAFLVNDVNKISLNEARKNYETLGAIDEESVSKVREPLEVEKEHIKVERILKFLKLQLIKIGCVRKKDQIHPFYEYQKQYFRIVFVKETNELILEKTENLEKARNNEWEECKRYDIKLEKTKLSKDIISVIKKQTKPPKPKKLTKAEKTEIIKEEINKWDPVGLIKKGANEEEYRLEITKIASKISKLETKEELGEHIEQVFQKVFGENIFKGDKKEVEKVAKQILKRIKQ